MTDTNFGLDKNNYQSIVKELESGATVDVSIGLFKKEVVKVNAVIEGEYAYRLTESGTLYRQNLKFDFPQSVARNDFYKPENVAKRQAEQEEQNQELEKWNEMSEWFLNHPTA
jgi:hypothetical protein